MNAPIHILSPEYPPLIGGVGDYSHLLACGLASAGQTVHVWCPGSSGEEIVGHRVHIHRICGAFDFGGLRRLGSELNAFPRPARLIVQWVPHGYGMKSVNILLTNWVWSRARFSNDVIDLIVHEPGSPFRRGAMRQNAAATMHRLMAVQLLSAATRVWVTTPRWTSTLKRWSLRGDIPFHWVPVPSTIPPISGADRVTQIRRRCNTTNVIGSFGTLGEPVASMLKTVLVPILQSSATIAAILIGSGSVVLRQQVTLANPKLADRVHATGAVSATEVSFHLQACDIFVQPYPDGVNTRRTSAMAILQHGKPLVTTTGPATETVWCEGNAVAAVPETELGSLPNLVLGLLQHTEQRAAIGREGHRLYTSTFDISRTVEALLS